MELYDVMRTTFACREFEPDPLVVKKLIRTLDINMIASIVGAAIPLFPAANETWNLRINR